MSSLRRKMVNKQRLALFTLLLLIWSFLVVPVLNVKSAKNPSSWGWKEDERVDNDPTASIRPDIVVDSKNRIHVVWADGKEGGGIFYKKYDEQGWSEDVHLDASHPEGGAPGGFPAITVDKEDNIHVAFGTRRTEDYNWEIYYVKFNGTGWSIPKRVTMNSGFAVNWAPQLGPRIVATSQGYVYIFWTGYRNYSGVNGKDIFYTYFNGGSWSDVQYVLEDTRPDCHHGNQDVVVDTNDILHLVYVSVEPVEGTPWYYFNITYRKFNGSNWSEPLNLGPGDRPSITVDSLGNVYVVSGSLYFTKIDREGNIIIKQKEITSFGNDEMTFQDSHSDSQGNIHIVGLMYYALTHQYIKTDNNGDLLLPVTYLTEGAYPNAFVPGNPRLAIDENNCIHMVFIDDRDGNDEIYYKSTYLQDLSVSSNDITFFDDDLISGKPVSIDATIYNKGEVLLNATVEFYINNVSEENKIGVGNVSVPANQSRNVTTEWTPITAGEHKIFVVINCTEVIAEANISNNIASKNVFVKSPHAPIPVIDSPKNFDIYFFNEYIYFDGSNSSDADNESLTFYWESNISGYLDNKSSFYKILPQGYHRVTLWADDRSGHNVSATVNITVKENQYPNIDYYCPETADITINETENQTFYITASDPEGLDLTYIWLLNNVLIVNATSNVYTFGSNYTSEGVYNIVVVVFDGQLSVTHMWNLTVLSKNSPPITEPIENQTAHEGQLFTLQINATDLDGDTLTFSNNSTLFDINSTTGFISFTPSYDSAGIYYVNITISDGTDFVWQIFRVEIINVNRKPIAIISLPQNDSKFTTDDNINFDASVSYDPDNDNLIYAWNSSIQGLLSSAKSFSAKLSAGEHLITLTVSDGTLSDYKQITITVESPPPPQPSGWRFIPSDGAVVVVVICAAVGVVMILRKLKKSR